MRGAAIVMAGALVLAGCGDPETTDTRGYTKAPLEDPGLIVDGEDASPMAALGEPNRPRPVILRAPEATDEAAGDAAAGADVTLAAGATQEQFDQGQALFTGQAGCQACHGPNAQGTTLAPDLTDAEWLNVSGPDMGEIAEVIRTGVPSPQQFPAPMPAMGGASLTDAQIQALAAYVASIGQS